MKNISCIIVDDEPIGREILEHFVSKVSYLNLVHSFDDAVEATLFLQQQKINLLITDINMPNLNGIELVKSLTSPPYIIFVTAHREFALDGFDNGAVDYMVKPVRFDRFLIAIDRVQQRFRLSEEYSVSNDKEFIFIKVEGKLIKVILKEIIYIEALGDYAKIITNNNSFITLSTLKSFEELLNSIKFQRVQRSFIVNTMYIQSFVGNSIQLNNDKTITISTNMKSELFKLLGLV
jgi:two-component system, LytTR family, response regulator